MQWLNAGSVHSDRNLTLRLRVTEGGAAVEGARLTVRFARPDAAPFYTQVVTGSDGHAEMKIDVDESSLPDSSVLVQASYSGRTATTRKVPTAKGGSLENMRSGASPVREPYWKIPDHETPNQWRTSRFQFSADSRRL